MITDNLKVVKGAGNKLGKYPYLDSNGYLWVDARITRLGIMAYRNQDDDNIHQELKNEKELFNKDTLDSFLGVPITIEHPYEGEVKPDTIRFLSVGTTMTIPKIDEGHYLRSRLLIVDPVTIDDILKRNQGGESYEVSCGYNADLDWKAGVWNGMNYDAVQRNIRFNHLALVKEGRAGPEVKLLI